MRAERAAIDAPDRQAAAAALGRFMRRMMVQVAIADLLDRLSVGETALAMSELADECIRTALDLASRFLGERARAIGQFCVLAMGKLGARELNLSSDVDLIYLHASAGSPDSSEAAARLGESFTEILSARCFRIDMRLRPGGRSAPLVTPIDGAINYYENLGEPWERAALLRARPVAGDLEIGLSVARRAESFCVSQLPRLRHAAPIARDEASDRGRTENARYDRAQHQARPRWNPRARIHRAGAHADLRRPRSPGFESSRRSPRSRSSTRSATCPLKRARELSDAYLFLRDVEHKLQVVAGLQNPRAARR